jgi:hypothetical protein
MKRRRRLLAAVLWSASAASPAQSQGLSPEGLRGIWSVHTADTAGRAVLSTGIAAAWHERTDSLAAAHRFSILTLHAGYGLSEHAEIGVALPLRSWWTDSPRLDPRRRTGFGDLLASLKLQLPLPTRILRLGTAARVSFPTGSRSRGWSSRSTDLEWDGLVTFDWAGRESFLPVRIHLNGGYRWNRNESDGVGLAPLDRITSGGFWPPAYPGGGPSAATRFNDAVPLAVGIEFATRILELSSELTWELHPELEGVGGREEPLQWTQGAVLKFRNGLDLRAAVAISLQRDAPPATVPVLPEWRFLFGVSWRKQLTLGDADHDGVADATDDCRDRAEDFDGFQDEDGCPDLDNDADGVPDRLDLAPDLPEDFDGFEDADGRPDRDNDGDGIRDDVDACRDAAEDFDGDADADGCPEGAGS